MQSMPEEMVDTIPYHLLLPINSKKEEFPKGSPLLLSFQRDHLQKQIMHYQSYHLPTSK